MKPTIEYIQKKFDEYNDRIFAGRLPKIPVLLSDAATFVGKCCFRQQRSSDGLIKCFDFSLRINTRIDYPESVIEDTIIHEMIHYFIHFNGLHDSAPHGELFVALMNRINISHNRNITIRHKSTPDEQIQARCAKRSWHVIAAIKFKTPGKHGVKVLPRVGKTILTYDKAVRASSNIESADYYLSDNPFFNRYPNSGALKVHDIDYKILVENLRDARRLRIDGTRIVEG